MKIVHFCPFAPNQCGMYETTRDMIKAERMQGHSAEMVNVKMEGVTYPHKSDDRGDISITPISEEEALDADLYVSNCNIPKSFLARTSAPVVQVIHGRPEGSFVMTLIGKNPSYDIYAEMAKGDRVKMFISLWKEHDPYFEVLVGKDKLRSTSYPPCDMARFSPKGRVHDWGSNKGKYNILIPETWREDRGPFHILHGLILLGQRLEGLKVHIYACNNTGTPWKYIFNHMKKMGILGEIKGMMRDIVPVYRAADLVVTSHRVGARIVREALCAGKPVAAAIPNRHTPYTFTGDDPYDIANVVGEALSGKHPDFWIPHAANEFNLRLFGKEIIGLYNEVLKERKVYA